MKIYTKSGDEGKSLSPFGYLPKNHVYFKTCGEIDELSALIGEVLTLIPQDKYQQIKKDLIDVVYNLGLILDDLWINDSNKQRLSLTKVDYVESLIDEMDEELTPLKGFIKPFGHPLALRVNVIRSVTRRVERNYFGLMNTMNLSLNGGIYLNRLSDYFFTLFRYVNLKEGFEDVL